MRDYQRELEELRERIAQRRDDMAVLKSLFRQEEDCKREVETRSAQWIKEERDVERLEKLTLSSVLASLRGNKDEEIDREKAEAYAARLRLQEAERQLDEIRSEIRIRQDRVQAYQDYEVRYERLLREKEAELRGKDPVLAEKLAELERQELGLTSRKKELQEAIAAGRAVCSNICAAQDKLNSAEGWSTWDMLGGGLIADALKYSSMDDAQRLMEQVQSGLRRYQAELADVAQTAAFDLQPNGFLQFADFFWDNIFTDWAVRDQIVQSQNRMWDLADQVKRIQSGLELELEETDCGLTALRNERNELVRNA